MIPPSSKMQGIVLYQTPVVAPGDHTISVYAIPGDVNGYPHLSVYQTIFMATGNITQ